MKVDIKDLKLASWSLDDQGRVVTDREPTAEFWRPGENGNIACDLCYRQCEIAPGEAGWCKIRTNEAGQMVLPSHGVISMAVKTLSGYSYTHPFLCYKPGRPAAFLGGVYCTAGCSFCGSGNVALNPDKLPWSPGEYQSGKSGGWAYYKAMLHPAGAIALADQWGATQITFGGNEPSLSFEWTYDVSRLAKRAGLDVCLETNGYTPPEVIRTLAPFVDAVAVGVKGSANERFYEKYVKSPGAVPHVLRAIEEWQRAGVHLTIVDVVAPPHMETESEFKESAKRFYGWLYAHLGELAILDISPMTTLPTGPGGAQLFLAHSVTREAYWDRWQQAKDLAREAGLNYVYSTSDKGGRLEMILNCHNCKKPLLILKYPVSRFPHICPLWEHQGFLTDGQYCRHCGASVPIKTY